MLSLLIIIVYLCIGAIIFCPIYAFCKAHQIVKHMNAKEKELYDKEMFRYAKWNRGILTEKNNIYKI